MTKKIILTGSSGMLGKDIVKIFNNNNNFNLFCLDVNKPKQTGDLNFIIFDLRNLSELDKLISKINPDIIIHVAAIVDIKKCEDNFKKALNVHASATRIMSQNKCKIIYISTDSIFNGISGNYSENSQPDPLNNYSISKFLGECAVRANSNNYIIIRTNIFGYNIPLNNSLAEWSIKMIENENNINGYSDVIFNPIYTKQLAKKISKLIKTDYKGVLNIGSKQKISKYDFIKYIATQMNKPNIINKVKSNYENSEILRPKNTTLNTLKASKIFKIPDIYESVELMISDYKKERNYYESNKNR